MASDMNSSFSHILLPLLPMDDRYTIVCEKNSDSEKLAFAMKLVASHTTEKISTLLRTPCVEEQNNVEVESVLNYESIFKEPGDGHPFGKAYLQKHHHVSISAGSTGLDQYHDLQKQVRLLFTNPRDLSVHSIIFCNYRRNNVAKDA